MKNPFNTMAQRFFGRNGRPRTAVQQARDELRHQVSTAGSPQRAMLHVLNFTHQGHLYAGTANPKTVAKRRAANRQARRSRQINRRRAA